MSSQLEPIPPSKTGVLQAVTPRQAALEASGSELFEDPFDHVDLLFEDIHRMAPIR